MLVWLPDVPEGMKRLNRYLDQHKYLLTSVDFIYLYFYLNNRKRRRKLFGRKLHV